MDGIRLAKGLFDLASPILRASPRGDAILKRQINKIVF
jgi:hypothetical protein